MRRTLWIAVVGMSLLGGMACTTRVEAEWHEGDRLAVTLADVTGGTARGRGVLGPSQLTLKVRGLTPGAEYVVELLAGPESAPRRLGQFVTTARGDARLRVGFRARIGSPGMLILVRRVVEETPGEVVLEGRVREPTFTPGR